MAEVFLAVDMDSDREDVAIKLFKDAFCNQGLADIAFSRELKSLQALNGHPNILQVRDFGVDASTRRKYIALPWIDVDLHEALQTASFEGWDDYYERIGAKLLDALSYAYSRDIIHRDIKPGNILLDKEGIPYVADFGISKFRKYYQSEKTVGHLGTPPYKPAEPLSGEYEDTRDVYAFGVLSIACVTGSNIRDYTELNKAVSAFNAPEGILEIVQRCLSTRLSSVRRTWFNCTMSSNPFSVKDAQNGSLPRQYPFGSPKRFQIVFSFYLIFPLALLWRDTYRRIYATLARSPVGRTVAMGTTIRHPNRALLSIPPSTHIRPS